jgi:hypothetical protein
MTDKKLTDNEIKKALECCTTNGASCKNCPAFVKVDRSNCKKYFRGALGYINRLQAQNERLCVEIDELIIAKDLLFDEAEALIKTAKSEARKEFAERLKSEFEITHLYGKDIIDRRIDNLLKELVGDK